MIAETETYIRERAEADRIAKLAKLAEPMTPEQSRAIVKEIEDALRGFFENRQRDPLMNLWEVARSIERTLIPERGVLLARRVACTVGDASADAPELAVIKPLIMACAATARAELALAVFAHAVRAIIDQQTDMSLTAAAFIAESDIGESRGLQDA